MFENLSIDRVGRADGRSGTFPESLYLLSADHTVIGMRPATHPTGPEVKPGDRFFDHFPINDTERATLRSCTNGVNDSSLLFRAGDRPMLAVCACYASTNTLLVAVPEGELKRHLDRPAAYDGILELEERLLFSLASLSRNAPKTVEGYDMLSDWVRRLHRPFFFEEGLETEYDAPVAIVAVRLMALARLCGCRLDFDLTAMSYSYHDVHPFELLIPTALSILMAVYRTAPDRSLTLYGWHEVDRGVFFAARFLTANAADRISELNPLRLLAEQYQRIFMAVRDPEEPLAVFCRFMGALPEFSAQDIKNDPRKIFASAATPQWKIYRIPGTDGDDEEAIYHSVLKNLEIRSIPDDFSKE